MISIFINLFFKFLVLYLFIFSSIASAQVEVSSAKWKNVSKFKYCLSGKCNTFRKVELNSNTIQVGMNISVTNLETKNEIANFLVKSIKYGRQVKMCWIGDSEGISGNYITVGGCSLN